MREAIRVAMSACGKEDSSVTYVPLYTFINCEHCDPDLADVNSTNVLQVPTSKKKKEEDIEIFITITVTHSNKRFKTCMSLNTL